MAMYKTIDAQFFSVDMWDNNIVHIFSSTNSAHFKQKCILVQ